MCNKKDFSTLFLHFYIHIIAGFINEVEQSILLTNLKELSPQKKLKHLNLRIIEYQLDCH